MVNLFNVLGGWLELQEAAAAIGGVEYGYNFVPYLDSFFLSAKSPENGKGIKNFFALMRVTAVKDKAIELEVLKPSADGFDVASVKVGRFQDEKETRLSKTLTQGTENTAAPVEGVPFIFYYDGIKVSNTTNRPFNSYRIFHPKPE